jgi:hypothetical protein
MHYTTAVSVRVINNDNIPMIESNPELFTGHKIKMIHVSSLLTNSLSETARSNRIQRNYSDSCLKLPWDSTLFIADF